MTPRPYAICRLCGGLVERTDWPDGPDGPAETLLECRGCGWRWNSCTDADWEPPVEAETEAEDDLPWGDGWAWLYDDVDTAEPEPWPEEWDEWG